MGIINENAKHPRKQKELPIAKLLQNSYYRIHVECDSCKTDYWISFQNYNSSQKKRKFDGKTICRKCDAGERFKKLRKGQDPWNKGITFVQPKDRKRKGYISSDGYPVIYDYRYCGRKSFSGYVKEHIRNMEDHLGRRLTKEEVVHHIDGNKKNALIENLYLCKNRQEHRNLHVQLNDLCRELLKMNIIYFDNGVYKIRGN